MFRSLSFVSLPLHIEEKGLHCNYNHQIPTTNTNISKVIQIRQIKLNAGWKPHISWDTSTQLSKFKTNLCSCKTVKSLRSCVCSESSGIKYSASLSVLFPLMSIWRTKDGKPEIDFEYDSSDFRLPELQIEELKKGLRNSGSLKAEHNIPDMHYSLRVRREKSI